MQLLFEVAALIRIKKPGMHNHDIPALIAVYKSNKTWIQVHSQDCCAAL